MVTMIHNNIQKFYQNRVNNTQNNCSNPVFKAKIPKTAEKEITEDALKIASVAIAASGIVYIGQRAHNPVLSKVQQEEILEKYKQGYSANAISVEYSCSESLILRFLRKQPNAEELRKQNKANKASSPGKCKNYNKKHFTQEQITKIIERYINGESVVSIAKDYDCSEITIDRLIKKQDNAAELKKLHDGKKRSFSLEDKAKIIERYINGESSASIAKDYNCAETTIDRFIKKQENAADLKKQHNENKGFLSLEEQAKVIERFVNGETYISIAKDYNCSQDLIFRFIHQQPNVDELKIRHKDNKSRFNAEEQAKIIERFISGESYESIAKDYDCGSTTIGTFINQQPNADELRAQHNENQAFFSLEEEVKIIERFINGETYISIAKNYNCGATTIWGIIHKQPNADELITKNKENREFFSKEQKDEISKNFKEGKSYETIAQMLKCSCSTVRNFILSLPEKEKLIEEHKKNIQNEYRMYNFTQEQRNEIIQRFSAGEPYITIAGDFDCSINTIAGIVRQQFSHDEIKNIIKEKRRTFSAEDIKIILERFIKGETLIAIARDYNTMHSTIRIIIDQQPDAEEINIVHRQNVFANTLKGQQDVIIKCYREGKSYQDITKIFDCATTNLRKIINSQPDIEDILAEHRRNTSYFSEDQMQEIFNRKLCGGSNEKIANKYNCSPALIWKIVHAERNKNKEGTTKETFWHKYEKYTVDELKTRISEFVSLKQVEENDELLEIMFFLDEKAKFKEDEKALSIDFIRLLDKLEEQKVSTKNVITSEVIKNLFDLMDSDTIRQQIYEDICKEFNATIDELNSDDKEALGDICSKYIAHNIDDEDKIESMKEILNILSTNDEKSVRHKLVAYDNMKQNPNDERVKKAEEIYGENNQEKIGQYIIFDQLLKGEYTNVDFDNDACKFFEELKDMHLNKDAIIKRLIELEDYFNSKEAENNSLTNFIKHFNSSDNYINKLLTDFYIDNIYKDKVTTIEVAADSKYFSGKNITLMIYPEAKQAALSNTEVNFDKHLFLIDSEEYAKYFASRKLGSLGVKIFTLNKSYQKEGFYSGENVLEIKVPNGYNGARLAAKIKNEDNRVFEIKYFMPKGFHKEKKRTDKK